MFTGLIQKVGVLAGLKSRGKGQRIAIGHEPWETPLVPGESVSVNGICLTVADCREDEFACDVLGETMVRTSLADKRPGSALNLERALRADERLGGHIVTGHVDGTGVVKALERTGEDRVLMVGCDAALLDGMVPKGSIAIDGVSLTIVDLLERSFTVHLIPHTWAGTAFNELRAGTKVNLETDLIGKYVYRYLKRGGSGSGLTLEKLAAAMGGISGSKA